MTMQQPATQASFTAELSSKSNVRVNVIQQADRWLRERSLLLLALAMVAAFSWPEFASQVLASHELVPMPLGASYDARTLALAAIVLSASLRCTPTDFTRVFRSQAGVVNLFAVYVLVPMLAFAVAFATLHFGHEAMRGVAVGLVLSVVVPVAMTSAVWTRASQGSVPLALGTLGVTSLLAVFLVPLVLGRLAGIPGVEMGASVHSIRVQVVLAFAVPLLLGTTVRGLLPKIATAVEPAMSIVAMIALLAFVGDSASALRPHLATHRDVLVIALVLTCLTNAASYAIGYMVAKARGLDEADTVAVVFGSGMRSVPAALVLGAIAFPDLPLIGLPPILWSVSQQLLAGVITRRFLYARDIGEPVLPLKRRVAETGLVTGLTSQRAKSRPSFTELAEKLQEGLEDSVVLPLCHDLSMEETLVYRPRKSAPSFPG